MRCILTEKYAKIFSFAGNSIEKARSTLHRKLGEMLTNEGCSTTRDYGTNRCYTTYDSASCYLPSVSRVRKRFSCFFRECDAHNQFASSAAAAYHDISDLIRVALLFGHRTPSIVVPMRKKKQQQRALNETTSTSALLISKQFLVDR